MRIAQLRSSEDSWIAVAMSWGRTSSSLAIVFSALRSALVRAASGSPTELAGMSGAVVFDDQNRVTGAVVFDERLHLAHLVGKPVEDIPHDFDKMKDWVAANVDGLHPSGTN